jgi:hypothetical protein
MIEYRFEEGKPVDRSKLVPQEELPLEDWIKIHQSMPIPCHDVAIEYQGGILLVNRNNLPAKNILWIMGGRMVRGLSTEESLRRRVKRECGLDLDKEIVELGVSREYWQTDPFNHGKGTDTIGFVYFSRGYGDLSLDNLHNQPVIITPQDYTLEFRSSLHPRIAYFMDKAISLVGKSLEGLKKIND